MPLSLGLDEKNKDFTCNTIDLDFPIAIPSPAGVVVGENPLAITFVNAVALAVKFFLP